MRSNAGRFVEIIDMKEQRSRDNAVDGTFPSFIEEILLIVAYDHGICLITTVNCKDFFGFY